MENLIMYSSVFSALIPIIIGFTKRKEQTRIGYLILVLVLISLGSDILSYISAVIFRNNYWVLHIYHILEITILSLFYFYFLKSKSHLYFWLIILCIYLFDIIIVSNVIEMNSIFLAVESLLFILYGVLGYFTLFKDEEHLFLDGSPEFWFNTAIITYFSGALFSWSMFHYLHQPDGSGAGIWAFHNIANILKNILFAIGLWKARAIV